MTALEVGGLEVWNGRARATDPGPTLDHLAAAQDVDLIMAMVPHRVQAERLPLGAAPELRVEVVGA